MVKGKYRVFGFLLPLTLSKYSLSLSVLICEIAQWGLPHWFWWGLNITGQQQRQTDNPAVRIQWDPWNVGGEPWEQLAGGFSALPGLWGCRTPFRSCPLSGSVGYGWEQVRRNSGMVVLSWRNRVFLGSCLWLPSCKGGEREGWETSKKSKQALFLRRLEGILGSLNFLLRSEGSQWRVLSGRVT